jgi:hypothetical protein
MGALQVSDRERGVRLRTYAQVWRLERVIYQIEGMTLPFAVTVQQVGICAAAIAAMVLLSSVLPGFARLSAGLRYLALPALLTWFLTRQRFDGKAPHRWVWGMLVYLFGPKRLNRLEAMPAGGRQRVRYYISWRATTKAGPSGPA